MIKIDCNNVFNNFVDIEKRFKIATKLYANSSGEKMVAEAKSNAPWKDITSLSRNTIDKEILEIGDSTVINIRGNTAQFKYLELAHEKKFSILMPTISKNKNAVIKGWSALIGK